MPALHTSEISWRSAKLKKNAAAYAKRQNPRTTVSKLVQDFFTDLLKRDTQTNDA